MRFESGGIRCRIMEIEGLGESKMKVPVRKVLELMSRR